MPLQNHNNENNMYISYDQHVAVFLCVLHRASYNNLFILSNLDTHIQYSVVLLDKIPLHVSGWLAHHQEVQMCTVHAAKWSSLCNRRVSC